MTTGLVLAQGGQAHSSWMVPCMELLQWQWWWGVVPGARCREHRDRASEESEGEREEGGAGQEPLLLGHGGEGCRSQEGLLGDSTGGRRACLGAEEAPSIGCIRGQLSLDPPNPPASAWPKSECLQDSPTHCS